MSWETGRSGIPHEAGEGPGVDAVLCYVCGLGQGESSELGDWHGQDSTPSGGLGKAQVEMQSSDLSRAKVNELGHRLATGSCTTGTRTLQHHITSQHASTKQPGLHAIDIHAVADVNIHDVEKTKQTKTLNKSNK